MKKELFIKDKNILNKNFYKEGGLVCSVNCSLHFHGLRPDNVCDVGQCSRQFTKCLKSVETLHVFP